MKPAWMAWPETQALVGAFAAAAAGLRFVGGCVRDAILSLPVTDVDAATPLTPDAVMALLKKAGIKAIPTGIDYGTVTAVIDKKRFEITTLRKDVATDGRWAQVEYTDDWKEDAARRDFAINALYLSPQGEIFDYFGGQEDLKAGHVRFIGGAGQRIKEDYLRILRFFRFFARYGKGEPDREALAACAKAAPHIATLSGERVQQEMMKLLAAKTVSPTLALLQQSGVMQQVLGFDIQSAASIERLEHMETESKPLLRLAVLLLATGHADQALTHIARAWKLSNADAKYLQRLLAEQKNFSPGLPLAEQRKGLRRIGPEMFIGTAAVSGAWQGFNPASMIHFAQTEPQRIFPLTGDDLIALGIKPGKEMGALLKRLEEEWEESDYTLTKEQLLKKIK